MRKLLAIAAFLIGCTAETQQEAKLMLPSNEALREMAEKESLQSIHPGKPGQTPFWNTYAKRFIYAPSFDFEEVDQAESYLFTAVSRETGEQMIFQSLVPWSSLSPVWGDLPVGFVDLKVEGILKDSTIQVAGERLFYKAAHFSGPYHDRTQTYQESIHRLLNYLFKAPYIQYWLEDNGPDPEYGLYCYPSKMYSAVIQGMLMILDSDFDRKTKDMALEIAMNVANELIEISQPEGAPLEFMPPTYTGPIYADMLKEYRGESLADRIMMIYPATVGNAYLDLFKACNDSSYFEAAVRIAETYKDLQLENGSWYLLIYVENGISVADNFVVPMGVRSFLERLRDEYDLTGYEECSARALSFVEENLLVNFNWEGQFEDQKPSEKYKNLSKSQACSYALYLFNNQLTERYEEAIELIRFAEDQFVIWEKPIPTDEWGIKSDVWMMPCVLEQYNFYTPVNASSANMIEVFRIAHARTGNPLYLAKAIALADNILHVQNPESGHYPTYLVSNLLDQEGWINCMVYTANAINDLDEYLYETHM